MIEYVDLQCPYCAQYAIYVLPPVLRRFVRTRRVQLEMRRSAALGSSRRVAARALYAAAEEDRMWQSADLFYHNQGEENSGYVTPQLLRMLPPGKRVAEQRRRRGEIAAHALRGAAECQEREALPRDWDADVPARSPRRTAATAEVQEARGSRLHRRPRRPSPEAAMSRRSAIALLVTLAWACAASPTASAHRGNPDYP